LVLLEKFTKCKIVVPNQHEKTAKVKVISHSFQNCLLCCRYISKLVSLRLPSAQFLRSFFKFQNFPFYKWTGNQQEIRVRGSISSTDKLEQIALFIPDEDKNGIRLSFYSLVIKIDESMKSSYKVLEELLSNIANENCITWHHTSQREDLAAIIEAQQRPPEEGMVFTIHLFLKPKRVE